ncbi:Poly(U)-binding-splicing factor half pint [Diplonema papillatum]|nr:Poly(U)-binding-splicing factor half pint [Diplonema papillatum]
MGKDADRRRRRKYSSSSSSSDSSSGERARRKRKAQKRDQISKWGMMDVPDAEKAPPAEAFGKTKVRGEVKFVTTASSLADPAMPVSAGPKPAVPAAQPFYSSVEDEPLNLSGQTAKIALMQKLSQNKATTVTAPTPLSAAAKPAVPVVRAPPKPELLNPLMAGPEPAIGGKSRAKQQHSQQQQQHSQQQQLSALMRPKSTFVKRTLVLDIPREKCGLLIGKQGRQHAALSAKYNCEIRIPSMDTNPGANVTVKGDSASVEGVLQEFQFLLNNPKIPVISDTTTSSRVVCLTNMVADPSEIDADLVNSVKAECSKFGPVTNVIIYDEQQSDNTIESKILIQFQYPQSATRSLEVMEGRIFDGRRIRCDYFSEDHFLEILNS